MSTIRSKIKHSSRALMNENHQQEDTDPSSNDKLIYADEIQYWRSGVIPGKQGILYHSFKRLIDIIFSIAFLAMGVPWLLVCGFLMKRETPGPMFYKQKRVGKDGRILYVYKLRSMPVDAEENGPQLTPVNGDKRIGPVGRFIRKAKIDELPQFWNVLKGEFTVVGPRPERPFFVERFSEEYPLFPLRNQVKPGLTGLAQINEKDSLNMVHKLRYDLFYIRKQSIGLDMMILWRTAMYCFKCLFCGFQEVSGGEPRGNCKPD